MYCSRPKAKSGVLQLFSLVLYFIFITHVRALLPARDRCHARLQCRQVLRTERREHSPVPV